MNKVTLTIDNQKITVNEDMTIMQAAEVIGVNIPRLCYHPDLSLEGACRVCVVKVEGIDYFVASCSAKVQEGMVQISQ